MFGEKIAVDIPFLCPLPQSYRSIFPPEFFAELFRLKGKEPVPLPKAPWIAQDTTNLIYQRIEDRVFDTLNQLNPTLRAKSSGKRYRRFKLHQFVADGPPRERLIAFIARCCEAMAAFSRWKSFLEHWNNRYPIRRDLPHELALTFADDSEVVFPFMYEQSQG